MIPEVMTMKSEVKVYKVDKTPLKKKPLHLSKDKDIICLFKCLALKLIKKLVPRTETIQNLCNNNHQKERKVII